MYRLLSCSQDTYICDKYVANTRSLTSNVGQAGTIDIYKLWNQSLVGGSSSGVELSRGLLKFDYSELNAGIVASASFTASIHLKDVYGGQTVPSNFKLSLYPLSKAFDEGRGFDVISYRDIDAANFLSASTTLTWSMSGAGSEGAIGDDVDIMTVGDLGSGLQPLEAAYTFARGDEDGVFNVTSLVSAAVAGIIPNNGFRLSYTGSLEGDTLTYFVKRFGSRHAFNKSIRPKLVVEWDDRIQDTTGYPAFDISQSFFIYNETGGAYRNFYSGSNEITGSNSLILKLIASKSVTFTTSSWQANFGASISHNTSSAAFYSQSFSASQYDGRIGIYTSDFILDIVNDSYLGTFLSSSNELTFEMQWNSLDDTFTYTRSFITFKRLQGTFDNAQVKNYVVNATNLRDEYSQEEEARIKVVVQNKTMLQKDFRYPGAPTFVIIPDMRWRLKRAYEEDIVIPFADSTRMSTDQEGMYFEINMQDLDVNEVYELEFMLREQGKDFVIKNKGFIFKVVK